MSPDFETFDIGVGENLTLDCSTAEPDDVTNRVWKKNDEVIGANNNYQFGGKNRAILYIDPVEEADHARFLCIVENPSMKAYYFDVNVKGVNISEEEEVLDEEDIKKFEVPEGHAHLEIKCPIEADDIVWHFNSKEIAFNARNKFSLDNGYLVSCARWLFINDVTMIELSLDHHEQGWKCYRL